MKKVSLSMALLIAGYFVFLLVRPSLTKKIERNGEPKLVAPVEKFQSVKKIETKPQGTVISPAYRPEENKIRFVVKHNDAIAYGDILLGTPEHSDVQEGIYNAPSPQLWDKSEIPYLIRDDLPGQERVKEAIAYFNQNTTVSFTPYNGEPDAIVFVPGEENCLSLLGKQGGMQPIKLDSRCRTREIIHEMMHALGFPHEQSRTDRDKFVEILWDNIDDKYKAQYDFVPDSFLEAERASPFDYSSVMLYRPDMFAREKGLLTMKSKTQAIIAPVPYGLSAIDLARLKKLYPGNAR